MTVERSSETRAPPATAVERPDHEEQHQERGDRDVGRSGHDGGDRRRAGGGGSDEPARTHAVDEPREKPSPRTYGRNPRAKVSEERKAEPVRSYTSTVSATAATLFAGDREGLSRKERPELVRTKRVAVAGARLRRTSHAATP